MPRNKEYTIYDLEIVMDSYILKNGSKILKIKYVEIEKHAAELGMIIKARSIARDQNAIEMISKKWQEYCSDEEVSISGILGYETFDIDGFFSLPKSQQRHTLEHIDQYLLKASKAAEKAYKKNREIIEVNNITKADLDKAKNDYMQITNALKKERKINCLIKSENAYFRKLVNKYICPEVANRVLHGEESKTNILKILDESIFEDMIENDEPESLMDSVQHDRNINKQSASEYLINQGPEAVLERDKDKTNLENEIIKMFKSIDETE